MVFLLGICWYYLLILTAIGFSTAENGQEKQKTGLFVLKKNGYRLKNSVYRSIHALHQLTCAVHCVVATKTCQSFNFKTAYRKSSDDLNCELNSKIASGHDDKNLEVNVEVDYFEKIKDEGFPAVITTCSTLKKSDPDKSSGFYIIKPSQDEDPFTVFCNMTYKNGVGVTVFSHNSEERTLANGYESPGSYKNVIYYNGVSMKQIESLINVSSYCEQFVKYECENAGFHFNLPDSWWVSRQGKIMKYWGGAEPDSGKCACGMTNSCIDPLLSCNCDKAGDDMSSEDSGFLTEMSSLPVKELRFGDTGSSFERGYHTVGKFVCWG